MTGKVGHSSESPENQPDWTKPEMWFSWTEQNWFLGMMNQLGNQFLAYQTRPNDRIAQEAWSIAFNFDTQQTMRQFATPPSPLFLSHTHMDTCLRITLENTNIFSAK
jgi:hypothetical protein